MALGFSPPPPQEMYFPPQVFEEITANRIGNFADSVGNVV